MSKSGMIRNIVLLGLITLCPIFLSCAAGMVTPSKGVTNQFFQQTADSTINLANYDFSRLGKGYGLCIFSYEFSGQRGNRIIGTSQEVKKGLRVWEHKFGPADSDSIWCDKKMMVWGYRGLSTFFLFKSGYDIKIRVPFHKDQIIYAGRLLVDFPDKVSVGSHFEEDMTSWLEQYKNRLGGISIDSVMMIAPI